MQKKERRVWGIALALFILVFGLWIWSYIRGVSRQLWMNSIRTITESTHQGANALNVQFEQDLNDLYDLQRTITTADPGQLADILDLYHVIEPDVLIYLDGNSPLRDDVDLDQKVGLMLDGTTLGQGIVDPHINSVTGQNVFDLFITGTFADGRSYHLVKEYRVKDIAEQFTLTFFDGRGFSYLVDREGNVLVRSSHKNSNKTANNLFDMISEKENDGQMLQAFKESIQKMRSGWAKFTYDKKVGVVFCYEPLRKDTDWLLVSVVPEQLITEQADRILWKTMLLAGTIVVVLLLLATFFYWSKMRENKIHTQELTTALNAADAASKAKGQFLMNMSHDIRTPLNAIIGMTAIAREDMGDPVRLADHLEKIRASGAHLLSLVNDVLDMSQIEDGKMILKEEPMRLSRSFLDVVELMEPSARKAGLDMQVSSVWTEDPVVLGDPLRIRQILINIIGNAVKYTPSGGQITLELVRREGGEEGWATYRFSCRDTGIGIGPGFLEKIFLPFERQQNTTASKIAGTGVGLSITKSLLGLMDGKIWVESQPGKGSVFTVELCLRICAPELAAEACHGDRPLKEKGPADLSQRRILLVEDNELNMEIATELIGMTGVQIEEAYDGQEAVELFEKNPEGYYDLIFMDIQMPVMDGYEATRRIRGMEREDARTIPIFAMSANALSHDIEQSRLAGMDGHIAKPIDMELVEDVLRRYITTTPS